MPDADTLTEHYTYCDFHTGDWPVVHQGTGDICATVHLDVSAGLTYYSATYADGHKVSYLSRKGAMEAIVSRCHSMG